MKKTYHTKQKKDISSICQLDNGTIVTSYSIQIGDYLIPKAHENNIFKIVALPNNRIASCCYNGVIKIWNGEPPLNDIPLQILQQKAIITSFLYIKEKNVLVTIGKNETLSIINMSSYQVVSVIKLRGSYFVCINGLYQIDEDRVIVGNSTKIWFVNIKQCEIENEVWYKDFDMVTTFSNTKYDKIVLFGCENGKLCLLNKKNNKYRIIESKHSSIHYILKNDDKTFFIFSEKIISLWSY